VQPLRWERRPDGLRAPALVCAFKGWNDAGEAATSAAAFMGASLDAARFATIDPEDFVDFQATRPLVKLVEGRTRKVEWPEWEVYEARVPRAPRDLVILTGPEPSYRWRGFCAQVVELAEALGVQMVVTLGALLADVPHSRPVGVTAHASDPALVERLSLQAPTYEGPTGIVGVLNIACREQGLATASVWANVPHYVSGIENPKAALALVQRVLTLLNLEADLGDLEEASRQYDQNLAEIVAQNAKIKAYVAKLESRDTAEEPETRPAPGSDLPPASELVAEIEQFLRQQRPE
jgi:proteasome assembly chaperone (PAC2) family protein